MERWKLQIELKSDFCSATGEAMPGMLNSKTALEYGIPYIPAKRIKGCLLEAGREMADNGVIQEEALYRIFGRPGMACGEGVRIGEGRLSVVPGYLFDRENKGLVVVEDYERLQKAVRECRNIDASLLEDIFTRRRTRTALEMETGTAKKHSLRAMQVVPSGIIFSSWIEGELGRDEEKVLALCAKGLRHMGIGITRGMGEVRCTLEKVGYENKESVEKNSSKLRAFSPEEEISLSYEIDLELPVIMTGGQEELNQIQASAVLGALAGMYIKKHSLGAKAHENEDFCRIFLRDGVQFGNAFLKRGNMYYMTAPKAFAIPKEDEGIWFNSMADKRDVRRKNISGQIFLEQNRLYKASPHKEIHFHHARPADRGIAHALNDRAEDTSIPTGQFFHYSALSKGQTFAGTWRGKAKDLLELVECLEAYQYRMRLGTSKTAEYGSCRFRVLEVDQVRRKGRLSLKGNEWFIWLLSPLVYRNPLNGAYETGSSPLLKQMEEKLNCKIELKDSICGYTIVNGYNSKWRLPAISCPAVSAGSAFYIRTDRDVEGREIEDMRWGMLTGKGCGQMKAMPWKDCTGGNIIVLSVSEQEDSQENLASLVHGDELLAMISKYRENRQKREESAQNALEIINQKGVLASSSDISLLIQMLKGRDGRPRCYKEIQSEAEHICGDGKRERILHFIKPCSDKSPEFMKQYLEAAKWMARKREEQDE